MALPDEPWMDDMGSQQDDAVVVRLEMRMHELHFSSFLGGENKKNSLVSC